MPTVSRDRRRTWTCLVAESDRDALSRILSEAGYRERGRTKNFVRFSHSSPFLMDVDVLLVDRTTFARMARRSRTYRVGAVSFRVPCLAHQIALKMHAIRNNRKRELRDLSDIVELLRANPKEVSRAELRSICGRYGPAGICGRLEGYL